VDALFETRELVFHDEIVSEFDSGVNPSPGIVFGQRMAGSRSPAGQKDRRRIPMFAFRVRDR
jgi:hypothetical protein